MMMAKVSRFTKKRIVYTSNCKQTLIQICVFLVYLCCYVVYRRTSDILVFVPHLIIQESVLMTMVTQLRCAIKENGDQCAMIIGLIMMQKWLVNNLDFPNLTLVSAVNY